MPLASQVFGQIHVARSKPMHRPVTEPDLHLACERDDELPPRRRVPIQKVAWRRRAKHDALGRLQLA